MKTKLKIFVVVCLIWSVVVGFECERQEGKLICQEKVDESDGDTTWEVFQDKSVRAVSAVFDKIQGVLEKGKEKLTPDIHKRVDQTLYDFHYFYNQSGYIASIMADGLLAAATKMHDKYEDVKDNEKVQQTLHETVEKVKRELNTVTEYGTDFSGRVASMMSEVWNKNAEKVTEKAKEMAESASSKLGDAKDAIADKAKKTKDQTRSILGTVLYSIAHYFGYEEQEEEMWDSYPENDETTLEHIFNTISTYSSKLTSTFKGSTMDVINSLTTKGEQGAEYSKEKMQKLHDILKKYSEQSTAASKKFKYQSKYGINQPTPPKVYTPHSY